jgi:hypothetical protein
MSTKALALAAIVGLLAAPGLGNAAPAAPPATRTGIATQSELLLVRDGCGRGFYLAQWQDRWGRWHRRCAPIRGWDRGWRGGWERPGWRPGWGWR